MGKEKPQDRTRLYIAIGVAFLSIATVTWLYQERQALIAEQAALSSSLTDMGSAKAENDIIKLGFSTSKVNADNVKSRGDDASLASEGWVGGGSSGESEAGPAAEQAAPEEEAPKEEHHRHHHEHKKEDSAEKGAKDGSDDIACNDMSPECADWARVGECENNKDWMLGTEEEVGNCRLSCGACQKSLVASIGAKDAALEEQEGRKEKGSMPEEDQRDLARDGEYLKQKEAEQLADLETIESATGKVTEEVRIPSMGFETGGDSEEGGSEGRAEGSLECADKSTNCEEWARSGECERNKEYMVGGSGYDGQCNLACGACPGMHEKKVDAVDALGLNKRVKDHDLKWPEKTLESGVVCIGISTTACVRGLWSPGVERTKATDRTIAEGVGGPTGCKQAWATMMTSDDQVAGVLVTLYTIRKYSQVDRDMVVFVTAGVSHQAIEHLQRSCVVIKRITEPFDPSTHIGFVKLNLWLAVEYQKIVYVENDVWFRKDPEMLFDYDAPAAVQSPPHPRVLNDVFNSDCMVITPNRQTFFDMISKVGTLDSAEKIDGHTVNSIKLFLSGYFDQWTTIPNTYLESSMQTVNKLVPEIANTRIRQVITSMPPYTKDTKLDYALVDAGGIQADYESGMVPWKPAWRIPCAWECRYRKYHHLHEATLEEWWHYYYDLVDLPLPQDRATFWLVEAHDPANLFAKKEFEFCLPISCEVPEDFVADIDKYKEDILTKYTVKKLGTEVPPKKKKKGLRKMLK